MCFMFCICFVYVLYMFCIYVLLFFFQFFAGFWTLPWTRRHWNRSRTRPNRRAAGSQTSRPTGPPRSPTRPAPPDRDGCSARSSSPTDVAKGSGGGNFAERFKVVEKTTYVTEKYDLSSFITSPQKDWKTSCSFVCCFISYGDVMYYKSKLSQHVMLPSSYLNHFTILQFHLSTNLATLLTYLLTAVNAREDSLIQDC